MQAKMLRWFVLWVGIMTLAGCWQGRSAGTNVSPVPPPQPFIFYDPTGNPSEMTPALSESELREITAWVNARTSRPVWFIRVQPPVFKTGKRGPVTAYLLPDEVTPRMRMGNVLEISERETTPPPWKYVQVSLANQPFTGQLTKPSVIDLPFEWWQFALSDPEKDPEKASPVPLEELVGIVDFVRDPSNFKDLTFHSRPEPPIRSIFRSSSGIEITFGFVRGAWITLERTPTGYRVKHSGWWTP